MTEDRLALFELIDQSADNDLVRDMLAFAAGRIMELEVKARTGAAPGARSLDRKTYRNGYRERAWGEAGQKSHVDFPRNRAGRIAPGVGPITAMAVVAAFDDAARFRSSSSVGAYLGLTPRRYESGEVSRNGRVSKRGDRFTRKCLYEAANAIFSRKLGGPRLREWAKSIAERTGPRKAKVALARKLAVTLHAMWRTNTPFREEAMA
jgi:transposase